MKLIGKAVGSMMIITASAVYCWGAAPTTPPLAAPPAATAATPSAAPAAAPGPKKIEIELKAPLFSPQFASCPVATVNDEPITVSDLADALASMHDWSKMGAAHGPRDYEALLDRLINIRLFTQEGTTMGLDELPEAKKALDDNARITLWEMLKDEITKGAKADPARVEELYKESAREWKLTSVKLAKEEDAKELAAKVAAGGDFSALVAELVKAGKAEGGGEGGYVKPKALLPEISAVVDTMKVGAVSQVVPIGPAFTLFRLDDIRYPESDAAREAATDQALVFRKNAIIAEQRAVWLKKLVKTNNKLLKKLDLEAPKPGFAKLLKDKRVITRIKGGAPITVGQLTTEIGKKFFHGIDEAIKEKKVNAKIIPVLDGLIQNEVYTAEARQRGLDKSAAYQKAVTEYRRSLMFGLFIQKAVAPDITLTEQEVKDYFDSHLGDYSTPEMMRLSALVFSSNKDAEGAVEKLRKGAEFQWVREHADGQVKADKAGLLTFGETPLVTNKLDEGLRKALAGAKGGDYRLYESPDSYFYLIQVRDVIAPQPTAYEDVREAVAKKLFNEKLTKAVDDWAEKLKQAYKVKVFMADLRQ